MNILLTGSTGHIGQRIVRRLVNDGHNLYLLIRPKSIIRAKEIFHDLKNIQFIEGDIEETDVVKNIFTISNLIEQIDCLIHLAAFYHLEASLKEAYIKNVLGTQNIINLIKKIKNIKYFHYFSTYAVNPLLTGLVSENTLINDDKVFNDHYSKTKNHAEHLVRNIKHSHLKIIIHRPGIIIGDSLTGEIDKIDGAYYFFNFILKLKKLKFLVEKLPGLPMLVHEEALLPIVPVDTLTDWSCRIINCPPDNNLTCYHLIPFPEVKTKEFLEYSMELIGLPIKLIPIPKGEIISPLLPLLRIPKEAALYMNQRAHFDRTQLARDYPELNCPDYKDYLTNIIDAFVGKRS